MKLADSFQSFLRTLRRLASVAWSFFPRPAFQFIPVDREEGRRLLRRRIGRL